MENTIKQIKFNLICDGNPVRSLDDLRNNFNIDDLLSQYHGGILHRWLKVRGYNDELSQISSITEQDDLNIGKKLVKIFDITDNSEQIDEKIHSIIYHNNQINQIIKYKEYNLSFNQINSEYFAEYDKLVNILLGKDSDFSSIKAILKHIAESYYLIIQTNFSELFWKVCFNNPLVVFCMLTIDQYREFYLYDTIDSIPSIAAIGMQLSYINYEDYQKTTKLYIYNQILELIGRVIRNESSRELILGKYYYEFKGNTDSCWQNIEHSGTKCLILHIGESQTVATPSSKDKDYKSNTVNKIFPIFDGLVCKSNDSSDLLQYILV